MDPANEPERAVEIKVEQKSSHKKKTKTKIRNERRNKERTNDWDFSLCQCCQYDVGIGCEFFFCYPCSAETLLQDLRNEDDSKHGCVYNCLFCCCNGIRLRQLAMNRLRIPEESCWQECAITTFCPCCSGAQIRNQIEYEKEKSRNADKPKGQLMR